MWHWNVFASWYAICIAKKCREICCIHKVMYGELCHCVSSWLDRVSLYQIGRIIASHKFFELQLRPTSEWISMQSAAIYSHIWERKIITHTYFKFCSFKISSGISYQVKHDCVIILDIIERMVYGVKWALRLDSIAEFHVVAERYKKLSGVM